MTKKGKKKQSKQNVPTSDEPSTSQSPATSQQQQQQQQKQTEPQKKTSQHSVEKSEQAPTNLPSQQQQQPSHSQQQGAQGRQQQQQPPHLQQQGAQDQQQKQKSHPQQQRAQSRPQQQQQQQQQPSYPQQQGAWGRPQQQQIPTHLPLQQQQQQPQQQGAWGRQQQHQQPIPIQQQSQRAWGPPQQQQRPMPTHLPQQRGAWGPPQQPQGAWGPPQQPQGAWSLPQQPQGAWGQSQQKQQQRAWGPPQQQQQPMPTHPSQQQPQGAWGPPQPQQQLQKAWGPPQKQQQPMPTHPSQQQSQGAWDQPQQQKQQRAQEQLHPQQQKVSAIKGDHSDIQQPQPSTSIESLKMPELSLRDTLQSTKTSSKTKMSSAAIKQYQLSIPKRRDPMKAGTLGTPIRLLTNMFEIVFDKNFVPNATHYDIDITPNAPKLLHKKVFEQCRTTHFSERYPAYDGKKNAFSGDDLPFNDYMETEVEIFDNDRDKLRTFKIILKKVAIIDLSWIKTLRPGLDEANRDQTAVQVLDIIMRHAPEMKYFSLGRSIYWPLDDRTPLGSGLCLGRGGFSSVIASWKPYLNVDVAHKAFPSPKNVVDVMAEFQENSRAANLQFTSWELKKIDKFLNSLKVIYQIPKQERSKRTYRLNGLAEGYLSANQYKFEFNESMMTIREYFANQKGYILKFPDLPCVWAGDKKRSQKIYLPAELCTFVNGQSYNKKLDPKQTRNMIRGTATDAFTRKKKIEETFKRLEINNNPTVRQEFHLSVSPKMKEVDGRILPPPELKYARQTAIVRKGVWQMSHFQQAKNLNLWTILDLSRDNPARPAPDLIGLKNMLMQNAHTVGMQIGEPSKVPAVLNNRNTQKIMQFFYECKSQNFKLIIVVIPSQTDAIYSTVKQISELNIGILTQCIKIDTVMKIVNNQSATTVKNILLKINSKLNGINHTFSKMPMCLQSNSYCMLVGADVTHPSPDSNDIPSIAAVAASQDTVAFQYNTELRLQPPKEEMILDLENIITSQISIYRDKTKNLPQKIIYYRDGVSEGQLPQIMHFEINAIRRACKKFNTSKNIEITCLVVQKRHHVRLFPTRPEDSDDKNHNVKAGTIVDTEITHSNHIDFYLVSHASIQGTARPTKYRCICNDSNYTEDEIEQLTYYLCHMYARCARAVSYPAPTYYAHLAAYRGRALIQGATISLDNLDAEQQKLRMKLAESPMYFI